MVILKVFIYFPPAILLLGIYPREITNMYTGVIYKNVYVLVLIVTNKKQLK